MAKEEVIETKWADKDTLVKQQKLSDYLNEFLSPEINCAPGSANIACVFEHNGRLNEFFVYLDDHGKWVIEKGCHGDIAASEYSHLCQKVTDAINTLFED